MNNKPNYNKGSLRNKIVSLLHVTTLITPRMYEIIGVKKSISNCISKLSKDDVIEKINNGEMMFNIINISTYKDNFNKYFQYYIDEENLEYFDRFGKIDLNTAKIKQKKRWGDSKRIVKNAEVTAMMYAAEIPTLPSDKKFAVQNHKLVSDVYYQSREIKRYAGYEDEINEELSKRMLISSRANGMLLSEGGNYTIYHLGRSMSALVSTGEYKLRVTTETMLSAYINPEGNRTCKIENALLYAYDINMFLDIIVPNSKINMQVGSLTSVYEITYLLPYNTYGAYMTKVMTCYQWKELIIEYCGLEVKDTSRASYPCDYYEEGLYVFIFCIPDIERFIQFVRSVNMDIAYGSANPKMFQIYLFDYQQEFVANAIGIKDIELRVANFEEFKNYWEENVVPVKKKRSQK